MSVYKLSNAGGLKAKTVYTSFLAGNTAYVPPFEPTGAYDSIATATPSAGIDYIDFTSIPSTYKHLQIRAVTRSADASAGNNHGLYLRFNSDASTNYSIHIVGGNGSVIQYGAAANQAEMYVTTTGPRSGDTAGVYQGSIIDIEDYASTTKLKTVRNLSGDDLNGSGTMRLNSGLWRSTAAITSIRIYLEGNYAANSQLALYGIKG